MRVSIVPTGRAAFLPIPGTTYLATIVVSLRDGCAVRLHPRHCVPGYYRCVPTGRVRFVPTIPGTAYLATIVLSLRDGCALRLHPRHYVPGYYPSVPTGRACFAPTFQALRTW